MELVQHHCRNCGGALHPYAEDKLKCQNCGSVYDVASAQKHTKQMRELFDEAKQELINNLRRNLYNAVNAEYVSSVEVQGFCTSLKQYLPDDFQANFYEIATGTNVRRISQAIREIDVAANYDDLDGVISYLIRSLQSEYLLELNNLVERAYKQRDLQKFEEYSTQISEEAEKVQLGVYETKLPREVFVAYSSKDMDKVSDLVSVLESQGLKCFVAARNLRHGKGAVENYNRALEEAMDHCRSFVFVSSCNSRNINCDALEIEIPYVEGKDIENSPAQYRNNYQSIPAQFKKPRVEYRIEESRGFNAADAITNKFFDGYERVYSPEEVAKRVMTQLVAAQSAELDGEEKKYCDACGHENSADAKFCVECGNRTFVSSIAEFIQLSKKKQDQLQRDAARRVEEAQKAAKANQKNNAKPPKKKHGCLIGIIITVVVLAVIGIVGSLAEGNSVTGTPLPDYNFTVETMLGADVNNGYFDGIYSEKVEWDDEADAQGGLVYDSLLYTQTGIGWYVSASSNASSELSGELVIPDQIPEGTVVGISDYGFRNCKKLTSVVVPETVREIGMGAFSGCAGLTEITLPFVGRNEETSDWYETSFGYIFGSDYYSGATDCEGYSSTFYIPTALCHVKLVGAEWIEPYAFRNCKTLTSISLDDTVARIGGFAFENCVSLTEITIPSAVTEISEYMFHGCTGLTRVRFDTATLETVAPHAFSNCLSLEGFNDDESGHFIFPDSIKSIGENALAVCPKVTALTVPFLGTQKNATGRSSLLGVIFGDEWFNECINVEQRFDNAFNSTSFCFPQGLKAVTVTEISQISAYAFDNCFFLTSIDLGGEITDVGAYAFARCTGLESLSLPYVTEIPEGMLRDCTELTSFFISDAVTSIGPYAFAGCSSLEYLGTEATYNGLVEALGDREWTGGVVVIPDSVTSIGISALNGCTALRAVSVPFVGASAKAKDSESAFGYIFGSENYEGGIESTGAWTSYCIPTSLEIVAVTGATRIPAYAFTNCKMIKEIYTADSVKTVGAHAFDNCSALTLVSIPSLTAISEGMLRNCTALTAFNFGESVTEIGVQAFWGCSSLSSINSEVAGEFIIPATVKTIGKGAFGGCRMLESLTIPFVGYSASSEYPDGVFGYIFGTDYCDHSIEVYQNSSYYFVPASLSRVTVTNAQKIVEYAFMSCTMLDDILINADVYENVHEYAFYDCTADVVYA